MEVGDKVQVVKFEGWTDHDFEGKCLDKNKPLVGIIESVVSGSYSTFGKLVRIKLFKQETDEFSGQTVMLTESELLVIESKF